MGLGIIGVRRLMKTFSIESTPGSGTRSISQDLPGRRRWQPAKLAALVGDLARAPALDPLGAVRQQNQELMQRLEDYAAAKKKPSTSSRNSRTPIAASWRSTQNSTRVPSSCDRRAISSHDSCPT